MKQSALVVDTGPLCFCLQPPHIVPWNVLPPPHITQGLLSPRAAVPKAVQPPDQTLSQPSSHGAISSNLHTLDQQLVAPHILLVLCSLPHPSCRFACLPALDSCLRNSCHVWALCIINVRSTHRQTSHTGVKAKSKTGIILSSPHPLSGLTP